MKNTKTLVPVLAIILCVSLSCTFLKEKFVRSGSRTVNIKPEDIATFDPKALLVSPGAIAVRRLADLDPTLSSHADAVEAVERAILTKARDEMRATIKQTGKPIETSDASTLDKSIAFAEQPSSGLSPASALMFQSGPSSPPSARDASLIAGLVSGLKTLLMSDTKNGSVPNKHLSYTEPKDGPTTSTMTMDVGSSTDGSTTFGIGGKTESTKNGVKVVAEFEGKIEGLECPNSEGQLPITVKVRLGAGSGGTGYTQDLTAFVRVVVDDNAQIVTTTIDVQEATQQSENGRVIYVESGETGVLQARTNTSQTSNTRIIQQTPNATRDEIDTLSVSGMNAAYAIGLAARDVAETKWQNGGCVQIEAASPGSVAVSSTTQIPVKVRHKYDGTEVPSKLEATLSGGSSVDPTLIPKTAGTLTYVAPGETDKTATIKLKSVSKRGIATLDLTATTGGNSYQIVGGRASWQTNTKVCDIMKPFTLTGGGLTVNFSGGLSGTYNYTGPYGAHGSGDTYSISLPDGPGKPGTMTGGGVGSAGGHSASDTETYKLSPIEPCSQ